MPTSANEQTPTLILDGFLTREQLAAQLNRSVRTIDRLEALRKGPPRVVIGRTILYRWESVIAWINASEVGVVGALNARRSSRR